MSKLRLGLTVAWLIAAAAGCKKVDLCEVDGRDEHGWPLTNEPNVDLATLTYRGNLTIDTSGRAERYRCLRHVAGDLTIAGNSAFDSASFAALETVGGDLSLDYRLAGASSTDPDASRIRRIDLPVLRSIGGDFALSAAEGGTGRAFDGRQHIGIDALTQVGGTLRISWRVGPGYSPEGLEGLTQHAGDLELTVAADQVHTLFMRNLARVDGDVRFESLSTVGEILPGLSEVGGDVTLSNECTRVAPRWIGPRWFPALQTIGGDLNFSHTLVSYYCVLMPELEHVDGTVRIEDSAIGQFPLIDHGPLEIGGLELADNPLLTTLGMDHVTVASGGTIRIQDNCLLPSATANAFVTAQRQSGWTGNTQIANNETGAASCSACFELPADPIEKPFCIP